MDWHFIMGAIAGIIVWNRLNPQIRGIICGLFSQDPLFETPNGASVGSVNEPVEEERPHTIAEYATYLTRAFNDGHTRLKPTIAEGMYKSASPLARYLYDYIRGVMTPPRNLQKPPQRPTDIPPIPTTKQQH